MQNMIIAFAEFLYNNLVTVSIILVGFLLLTVTSRLIYLEYRLNRQLNLKKIFFRDRKKFKARSFNLRRIFALFLGITLLGLIVYRIIGSPIIYQENTQNINNLDGATSIYEEYNSKFYSDPFINSLSIPEDDQSFESYQADSFTGFDYVIESNDYIFVLNQEGVQILLKDGDNISYLREISFPQAACSLEKIQPQGMALLNNELIILTTESLGQCVVNPEPYALRDNRIHVFRYNIDEFELINEYVISGHLTDAYIDSQQLILTHTTWIPFADEDKDLNQRVPFYVVNDETIKQATEEILYIENTNPNSFVTATKIDFIIDRVNQSTLLTDYQHQVDIRRDGIIFAVDKVNFNQVSDVFELLNPIRSVDTALIQINIFNEVIYYFRTQVIEGTLASSDAVHLTEEGVFAFTKKSNGRNTTHFFTDTLRYVEENSLVNDFRINTIIYDKNYFYIEYEKDLSRYYVYQNNGDNIQLVSTRNDSIFYNLYYQIDSTNYVAVEYFDNGRVNIYQLKNDLGSSIFFTELKVEINLNSDLRSLDDIDIRDIILSTKTEQLLIPMYAFSNIVSSESSYTYVDAYSSTQDLIQRLDMGPLSQYKTPFQYRALSYGDKLVHITPGGFKVTDLYDLEDVQKTIYFDNQ